MARPLLIAVVVLAAIVAGGCNKQAAITVGETEGPYITVDEIKYQIQISRILNPAAPDDADYMRGLPAGEKLSGDEVWYGIFLRSQNDKDKPHQTAREFKVLDTQGAEYEPVVLDPQTNLFAYRSERLAPGKVLPALDTPASDNTIRGSLLLFKIPAKSLDFRPLELEIVSPSGGENAVVAIDI